MPSSPTMAIHPPITKEEFNLFHAIDRRLFSVLIFSLGRDPAHATRVIALWLWLERVTLKSTIIHSILTLSYSIIDTIFEESMLCLHVAAFGLTMSGDIPVLTALLNGKNIEISLPYFNESKAIVLHGVGKLVEEVCLRGFEDIVDRFKVEGLQRAAAQLAEENESRMMRQAFDKFEPYNFGGASQVVEGSESRLMRQAFENLDPYNYGNGTESNVVYDDLKEVPYDYQAEIDEVLKYSRMHPCPIDEGINREGERARDQGREGRSEGKGSNNKTLFLTFSKGYPISKLEVREFFTRVFGDIIEGLHMQEVGMNEQPLYARLVVREPIMMDAVLHGQRKIKFSINGKHACVRKYVRRRSESPPTPPAMD